MKWTDVRMASHALVLVAGLTGCGEALAQDYYEPQASAVSDGSYTVRYVPDCGPLPPGFYCLFAQLEEKVGTGGSWSVVSEGSSPARFDDRSPGTYVYRVHAAAWDNAFAIFEAYSPEVSVVVGGGVPARDPLPAQLSYQYRVRQGDIDGDGRLDFLLSRISGGQPANGAIDEIVLQQRSGRRFSALVPTSYQSAVAAGWPESAVEPVLEDFNVDGYADVALTGIDAVVPGAADQFVYAPGQPGVRAPQGVRAFDGAMVRFVSDTMDYLYDQDYFADYAPVWYYQDIYWYGYCELVQNYYGNVQPLDFGLWYYWTYADFFSQSICYVDEYYQTGFYQDFSGFSDEALLFWQNDYFAAAGWIDERDALDEVETSIEQLIGVGIGGWPMEEVLGPVGAHRDPFLRAGIELGRSVLAQAIGGRNRTTSRLMPEQRRRLPDQIYITGHPLQFARSRGHLAVEYVDSLSGIPAVGETFSAEPERDSILDMGRLIAKTNRPTDHPLFNFFIAEVEPKNVSDYVYWQTYLKPRHLNYIALPYEQKPRYALLPGPGSGAHNSNSYIAGITYDSPANVDIDVPPFLGTRYPGWNQPVPDYLFQ